MCRLILITMLMFCSGCELVVNLKGKVNSLLVGEPPSDADAQHLLGLMYAKGEGVPKDIVTAYMWLNLARATGIENAKNAREMSAKLMSSDQIVEAQKRSRFCYESNYQNC